MLNAFFTVLVESHLSLNCVQDIAASLTRSVAALQEATTRSPPSRRGSAPLHLDSSVRVIYLYQVGVVVVLGCVAQWIDTI